MSLFVKIAVTNLLGVVSHVGTLFLHFTTKITIFLSHFLRGGDRGLDETQRAVRILIADCAAMPVVVLDGRKCCPRHVPTRLS